MLGKAQHLMDTIYVDNAAQAHLQAFEAMRKDPASVGGKAYFLSQDDPVPIRTFTNQLLATGGLPPVDKTIPTSIGRFCRLGVSECVSAF